MEKSDDKQFSRKWEDEPSTGNHKGKQVMEVDFDHDLLQQTYTYIPR
jgi:hypothetical protein